MFSNTVVSVEGLDDLLWPRHNAEYRYAGWCHKQMVVLMDFLVEKSKWDGRRRRRSDSLLSLRAEEERGSTFDNSEEKQEKRWCGSRSLEASSQRIAEPRWRQQEKRKKERQSLSELSTKWTTHREVHCWKVSISYYLADFLSIIALANLY